MVLSQIAHISSQNGTQVWFDNAVTAYKLATKVFTNPLHILRSNNALAFHELAIESCLEDERCRNNDNFNSSKGSL